MQVMIQRFFLNYNYGNKAWIYSPCKNSKRYRKVRSLLWPPFLFLAPASSSEVVIVSSVLWILPELFLLGGLYFVNFGFFQIMYLGNFFVSVHVLCRIQLCSCTIIFKAIFLLVSTNVVSTVSYSSAAVNILVDASVCTCAVIAGAKC